MEEPKKTRYSLEQKQACADLCGVKVATVNKYVTTYHLDASAPSRFKDQYDAIRQEIRPAKDVDHQKAIKSKAVTEATLKKVLLENAELELEIKKGKYISIEEESALWSHVGLMIKTHIEAMGGSVSMMCEGKSAKEIKKVIDAKGAEILFQLSTIK
jgi:uncharacterized protein YdgA (DUF945 family)